MQPSPQLNSTLLLATPPPPSLCVVDGTVVPDLLFNFEDDYASLPSSPLGFHALDVQPWSYTASPLCSSSSSPLPPASGSCDPYVDAATLFDAFVYH